MTSPLIVLKFGVGRRLCAHHPQALGCLPCNRGPPPVFPFPATLCLGATEGSLAQPSSTTRVSAMCHSRRRRGEGVGLQCVHLQASLPLPSCPWGLQGSSPSLPFGVWEQEGFSFLSHKVKCRWAFVFLLSAVSRGVAITQRPVHVLSVAETGTVSLDTASLPWTVDLLSCLSGAQLLTEARF